MNQAKYRPERVINGTHSTVWVDDVEYVQATSMSAKLSLQKTEVNQVGTLYKGYKVTGIEGKGNLRGNKIDSFFIKLILDAIKEGKTVTAQIRSKLADPESAGAEDILLTGVTFDEIDIINWEAGKNTEEDIPFSFTGAEILESIDHASALA